MSDGLVNIDIKGLKELTQNLANLTGEIKLKGGEVATRAGAAVILKAAKNNVPVQTGTLKRTLKIVKMSKKGDGTVRYFITHVKKGNDDPWYAHIVEFGGIKGSYKITPKRKKALSYFYGGHGRSGGSVGGGIYKSVTHPPVEAQPYMRDAFDESAEDSIAVMAKRLDKYINTLAGKLPHTTGRRGG